MWSAPYTLDNVPITGYNINDDQGTLIDTVNTTEYILTSSNDDPCNVTAVYVSGINGAGIGDSESIMLYTHRGNSSDYLSYIILHVNIMHINICLCVSFESYYHVLGSLSDLVLSGRTDEYIKFPFCDLISFVNY